MKLGEIKSKSKNIKEETLSLIDIKIENDMKEVISKLDMIEKRNETNFKLFEANFKLLLWVVGIAFAVIAVAGAR